jgi:hypothetical protein
MLALHRIALVPLGVVAAVLMVRELDSSLAGMSMPLAPSHVLFGLLLAPVVMPGPILGFFVGPRSSPSRRGLAVGASVVTAFIAFVALLFLVRYSLATRSGGIGRIVAFAWAGLALLVSAQDFRRLRLGDV